MSHIYPIRLVVLKRPIFQTQKYGMPTEEGSFSKLRRIQNYLRSSIVQEKLSMLSLMSMEHEILGDTDLETTINDFVCNKCGVMKLFVADVFSKSTH